MNYSDKLKDPRWQKRRLQIFERDKFTCKCCGDKETTLHVHHIKYTGEPWDAPEDDLMTLCEDCHFNIDVNNLNSISVRKLKGYWGVMFVFIWNTGVVIKNKWAGDNDLTSNGIFDNESLKFIFDSVKEKL